MGLVKGLLFLLVASSPVPTDEKFIRRAFERTAEYHKNAWMKAAIKTGHAKQNKEVLSHYPKIVFPEIFADGTCSNDLVVS